MLRVPFYIFSVALLIVTPIACYTEGYFANRGTVNPLRVGKGSLRPPLSSGASCGDSFVNRSEAQGEGEE